MPTHQIPVLGEIQLELEIDEVAIREAFLASSWIEVELLVSSLQFWKDEFHFLQICYPGPKEFTTLRTTNLA